MKKTLLFIFAAVILPNSIIDTVWIDNSISKMNWIGYKVTGSHYGQIKIKNGYVLKNEDLITGGEITIDLESISVEDIKNIEVDENNFRKYDFLLKLFDKADIINQLNLNKIN